MNKILSNKGMSLIQVMMGFALAGVLSVVMMKMMENQTKQAKTAKYQMEENNLKSKLSLIANRSEFCGANFKGRRKGTDLSELLFKEIDINNPADSIYLSENDDWEKTGLIVEKFRILSTAEELAAGYTNAGKIGDDGTGEIHLRVSVRRKGRVANGKSSFFGSEIREIDVTVTVKLGLYASYVMYGQEDDYNASIKDSLNDSCVLDETICEGCSEPDEVVEPITLKSAQPCVEDTESNTTCDGNIAKQILEASTPSQMTYLYTLQCRILDSSDDPYIWDCITNN
jgi:hypothetical protein